MRPVKGMHACNFDRCAAQDAQWQELELIFGRLLQHGNMRKRREGSSVCITVLDQLKRSCVRVVNPWKLHVSVNENAHTFVSSLLPVFKGFYDTHMRHTSVSYRHAKRSVHFIYIIQYMRKHGNTDMHAWLTR